jgi:DNA-directed RNA polymerase subunit K/omega
MGQLTNLEFEELKTDISTRLELVHQIERRAKYIGRNIKQQKKNLKNSGQTDPLFA